MTPPTEPGVYCEACSDTLALAHALHCQWVHCHGCGAEYRVDRPAPVRVIRTPRPTREDEWDRRVHAYVYDVLRWDAQVSRAEQATRGDRSPLYAQLRDAESFWLPLPGGGRAGVLGTGCSGTKGAGHAPAPDYDPRDVEIDPEATARYQALRGQARAVTDAVIADGAGFQIVVMHLAGEDRAPFQVHLEQRVALSCAPISQQAEWNRRIVGRDSVPALANMDDVGRRLLRIGAEAWQKIV